MEILSSKEKGIFIKENIQKDRKYNQCRYKRSYHSKICQNDQEDSAPRKSNYDWCVLNR